MKIPALAAASVLLMAQLSEGTPAKCASDQAFKGSMVVEGFFNNRPGEGHRKMILKEKMGDRTWNTDLLIRVGKVGEGAGRIGEIEAQRVNKNLVIEMDCCPGGEHTLNPAACDLKLRRNLFVVGTGKPKSAVYQWFLPLNKKKRNEEFETHCLAKKNSRTQCAEDNSELLYPVENHFKVFSHIFEGMGKMFSQFRTPIGAKFGKEEKTPEPEKAAQVDAETTDTGIEEKRAARAQARNERNKAHAQARKERNKARAQALYERNKVRAQFVRNMARAASSRRRARRNRKNGRKLLVAGGKSPMS